jgi:hypothetical protein
MGYHEMSRWDGRQKNPRRNHVLPSQRVLPVRLHHHAHVVRPDETSDALILGPQGLHQLRTPTRQLEKHFHIHPTLHLPASVHDSIPPGHLHLGISAVSKELRSTRDLTAIPFLATGYQPKDPNFGPVSPIQS